MNLGILEESLLNRDRKAVGTISKKVGFSKRKAYVQIPSLLPSIWVVWATSLISLGLIFLICKLNTVPYRNIKRMSHVNMLAGVPMCRMTEK